MGAIGNFIPGYGLVQASNRWPVGIGHWRIVFRRDGQGASSDAVGIQAGKTACEAVVISVIDNQTVNSSQIRLVDGGVVGTAEVLDRVQHVPNVILRSAAVQIHLESLAQTGVGGINRADRGPYRAIADLHTGSADLHGIGGMGDARREPDDVPADITVKGHTNVTTTQAGVGKIHVRQAT